MRARRTLSALRALGSLALAACSPPPTSADAAADGASEADVLFDVAAPDDMVPDGVAPEAGPDGGPDCSFVGEGEPEPPVPAIHTPRWAFEPWISKDISTADDTRAFVRGFRERDIPVGVVVLDSPWETHYNTFVPNPSRYPNFSGLVSELHGDNIRLVLWVTQMVNRASFDLEPGGDVYTGPSPNYAEGRACGFYVNDGAQYVWWKGTGSGVDFFNPRARAWWHRQQDALLTLGLDGWKLDFGESYVTTPMVRTAAGTVPHQQYSEAYYRDYLAYGVSRRGRENFVTMVRPWDESYEFAGRFFARREHAPVAWVGDNRRDFRGLADALDHIFRSAAAGYVVVGSDVGGYLDLDDRTREPVPANQDAFARWTAVGALGPFMQLHGRANLTPWTVSERTEETLRLYRYWSKLHHELVPFFYSLAEESYAHGGTIIRPVGAMSAWPGDYRYTLGEAFLVAPVLDGTGRRDVALPEGASYYDWWNPMAAPLTGGQTLRAVDTSDRTRIPLYVRGGALVPLLVADAVTGLGSSASAGALTILAYPSAARSRFVLHDEDDATTEITMEPDGDATAITLSRATRPVRLRVREDSRFAYVELGGAMLPYVEGQAAFDAATTVSGVLRDGATRSVWVKLPASTTARTVRLVLR